MHTSEPFATYLGKALACYDFGESHPFGLDRKKLAMGCAITEALL